MQDSIQISGLEPMIAPEGVAFWPPAPGWYGLFAIVILALAYMAYRIVRQWRRNRYRREALMQLTRIREDGAQEPRPVDIAALNHLLKLTAIHCYTRERVASLSGKPWLEFLSESCSKSDFNLAPGNLLGDAGFLESGKFLVSRDQWMDLIAEAETWIRKHR